jgi:hypothetical protein
LAGRVPENENRDATTPPPDDVAIAETVEVSTVMGVMNPEPLRTVRSNDKTRANPELIIIIILMSIISAGETLLNVTSFIYLEIPSRQSTRQFNDVSIHGTKFHPLPTTQL